MGYRDIKPMDFPSQDQKENMAEPVWSEEYWRKLEETTRRKALQSRTEDEAWEAIIGLAQRVMSTFSTSFFLVSRLLPPPKREMVEAIYAAVRYPDEIVDSFPLSQGERERRLDEWAKGYEMALTHGMLLDSLQRGVPPILAGFGHVCHKAGIPKEYYRSFLAAMYRDIHFQPFNDLQDLIDSYIYGSAIVVGYFLTHVYGVASDRRLDEAMDCSRHLGIALQLTNFLRDVGEDRKRGRVYLPVSMLSSEGTSPSALLEGKDLQGVTRVIHRLADIADRFYQAATDGLDVFSPDCRIAIDACIRVYRGLNDRISRDPDCLHHRQSLSLGDKIRTLPPRVYWRLFLGWMRC